MPVDQLRLEREGVFETSAPIRSIMADLGELETILDRLAAEKRKVGMAASILIVVALAGFILGNSLHSKLAIWGSVVALSMGIILWVRSARTGHGMLKNRTRCILLKKLLESLLQDADASAKSSVRMGLKGAAEVIREGAWSARKNGKEKLFRDRALELESELQDGTIVSEQIMELARKRTYQNPRGKSKTKIRNHFLIVLRFSYPGDLYGDARRAQASLKETIRVPSSTVIRAVRVTERAIVVKALVKLEKDILDASVMSALGAYRILNLARRAASMGRKK